MPLATPLQAGLNAGEFGPRMAARTDFDRYPLGCSVLENFLLLPQGGAARRPGTRFVAEVKDSTKRVRLISFVFSTVQAYVIEAGHLYFRFYKDGGRIESPPGTPVEIATPYAEADLASLQFAQSADVLFLVHPSHAPRKLSRTSHTSWTLTTIPFNDGPYQATNVDTAKTLAPSATSGAITITASGHAPFVATDVGRLVRIKHGTTWGYAEITGFTSTTAVSAQVKRNFGGASASSEWRLGSWSATTGYPQCVGFFEQRLCFAATSAQPQTLWLSQSADFENMQPDDGSGDIHDDHALDYTISSEQVNVIRWIAAGKNLLLGTLGGEWRVTSSGPLITPTDIDVKQATSFGSANRQAIKVRGRIVYLQRARRKLFEFVFDFNVDNFASYDQTLLADHVTKGGIGEIAYQQELDSVLWCVRDDGQLATLTYQPDQKVIGWSRQILGGRYLGGAAVVETVAAIPAASADEVWVAVKRTIPGLDPGTGATKRYIEIVAAPFETGDDAELATYADASLTLNSPKAITGATRADPVVVTAPGHGFGNGDAVRIEGVAGMTELNKGSYVVANATANTFELAGVDGMAFGAYVAGGEARKKASVVAGLGHLEGETVKVLADGAVHPDRVVVGGQITLDGAYAKVVAGLGYTHVYESLKWEAGSATGTAQGQVKRIDGVTLVLLDSLNASVGPAAGRLKPIPFRAVGDPMDTAVPLFTGEKFIEFDGDYALDARVRVEGAAPAPFTLLAVAPHLKTNAR